MSPKAIQVIVGTATVVNDKPFIGESDPSATLALLEQHHIKSLETAQAYGDSEKRLSEVNAGEWFSIDTK